MESHLDKKFADKKVDITNLGLAMLLSSVVISSFKAVDAEHPMIKNLGEKNSMALFIDAFLRDLSDENFIDKMKLKAVIAIDL